MPYYDRGHRQSIRSFECAHPDVHPYSQMKHGADAVIVGRNVERLETASKEMEKLSGRRCIPAPADVRKPAQLKEAVEKTIATFGRIDFVICGASGSWSLGNVLSKQSKPASRCRWQLPRPDFRSLGECVQDGRRD